MRKQILGLTFFSCLLNLSVAYADVNLKNLVKVTPANDPKCVEYYSYKDELYCSSVALINSPVDTHIKDSEKQKIKFDDRVWAFAWGQVTPTITTIEYIPRGTNVNNWHELVTSQFVPGLQQVTPKEYADVFIKKMEESGFKATINFIEEKPDQVIFEFKIAAPESMKQDELQKITKGKDGFYILHYAIKEADMSQANRDKWLKNLEESSIK